MKISDPLGKVLLSEYHGIMDIDPSNHQICFQVYTHTMFKKKSYNIPKGGEEDYLERGRSHSDDEDDDGASDISEQSDDSLSTKSSR